MPLSSYLARKLSLSNLGAAGERLFDRSVGVAGGALRAGGYIGAAGAGLGVGTAIGMAGAALGATYLGYRAFRGPSKNLHTTLGKNSWQLNPWAQNTLMLPANPSAAVIGMHNAAKKPWVTDMSPNGNLENKTPAQFNATGDIVLSGRRR